MAKEPKGSGTGNGNGNQNPTETGGPSQALNVLAQYVKDFSFENPNAPRSLGSQQTNPQITLTVNVNGKPLTGTDYEVELSIEGGAGEGANTLFKFELLYGAVLRLVGIPEDSVHAVVMIEGPRLMFPFARADHRRCHPPWRVPAAHARPHRFRRALPQPPCRRAGGKPTAQA